MAAFAELFQAGSPVDMRAKHVFEHAAFVGFLRDLPHVQTDSDLKYGMGCQIYLDVQRSLHGGVRHGKHG